MLRRSCCQARPQLHAEDREVDRHARPRGPAVLDDGHRDGQPRSRGAAAFGPPPASGVPSASVRLHIADEIRQQLEGERFPREVEGPEPETLPHLRVRCHSRDPDDRSVRRRGTATQELQAVHARKADVEQDGIGRLALEGGQRGFGAVNKGRLMTELDDDLPEHLGHFHLVVDHEDPHRFADLMPAKQIPRACLSTPAPHCRGHPRRGRSSNTPNPHLRHAPCHGANVPAPT